MGLLDMYYKVGDDRLIIINNDIQEIDDFDWMKYFVHKYRKS